MRTITWLHLSDLHFKESSDWNRKVVLDALLKDIENRKNIDATLTNLDFIAITGDLVYHGYEKEYEIFTEEFLSLLLQITKLDTKQIFIVPGNHDINRDNVTPLVKDPEKILTDRDITNKILEHTDNRNDFLSRLKIFFNWFKKYFSHISFIDDYFYAEKLSISDINIAILGLNSAWNAYGDDKIDKGKLVLGEQQVYKAIENVKSCDLIIALMHHPFLMFQRFDKGAEVQLRHDCHFIIQGHNHQPDVRLESTLAGETRIIQAGAAYDRREYPNGYNFVSLDIDNQNGFVYLRYYNDLKKKWVEDTINADEKFQGRIPITIPKKETLPLLLIREDQKYTSFEILSPSVINTSSSAEKFYNGAPPTWADLEKKLDFERDVYLKNEGVRDTAFKWMKNNNLPSMILFLGTEGDGKTTLLKRLVFDLYMEGITVLRQRANKSLSVDELNNFWAANKKPFVLMIDELLRYFIDRNESFRFFEEIISENIPILIICTEQLNRWYYLTRNIQPKFSYFKDFTLRYLSKGEQIRCINKIVELEKQGLLQRKSNLTYEDMLRKFKEKWDSQLLVALLEIRYDGLFEDIVIKEFDEIPNEKTKWLYGIVCYLNSLQSFPPITLLRRISDIENNLENLYKFSLSKEGLLFEEDNQFRARHRRIAYVIKKKIFSDSNLRSEVLKQIFSNINFKNDDERIFFLDFYGERALYRHWIHTFDDINIIRDILKIIRDNTPLEYKKYIWLTQAASEWNFKQFEEAGKCYIEAIRLDPSYSFSYRQYAWLERERGGFDHSKFDHAIKLAKKACEIDPNNFLNQYHCGLIMKMNKVKYFFEAKVYLENAVKLEPQDGGVQYALKSYEEYEKCLKTISSLGSEDIIPKYILESFEAGIKDLYTLYPGKYPAVFKAYGKYLYKIANQEYINPADEILLNDEIFDSAKNHHKSLRLACLARAHYIRLEEEPIEHDEIEKLFLKALNLNKNNAYAHNWYGTFLKEIRKNYELAENKYQTAINIAKSNKNEKFRNNPLFLNNMALLIMDKVQQELSDHQELHKAKDLLEIAVKNMDLYRWSVPWPKINLETVNQMIKECF